MLFLGTEAVEQTVFISLIPCLWAIELGVFNYFTYLCIDIPHTQNPLNFEYKIQGAKESYSET